MVGARIMSCGCGLCTPREERDPEINHLGSSKVNIFLPADELAPGLEVALQK